MNTMIIQVDGVEPNLALMKLSAWRKKCGDNIDYYPIPFKHYDLAFMSKIFDFSPNVTHRIHADVVSRGGTGYDLTSVLVPEAENSYPDYETFGCDYAVGFTTRGCVRSCPFCVVPQKEGIVHRVADLSDFWHGQEKIQLLDNNLTASPTDFERTCLQLADSKALVNFSQGLDLRLITYEQVRLLKKVKRWKQIHFAWDNIKEETEILRGINILKQESFSLHYIMVYVLIGYDSTPEEDLYRVETLRKLGVDPFVMPFNKKDSYQKRFARWCNAKQIFRSTTWEEYYR